MARARRVDEQYSEVSTFGILEGSLRRVVEGHFYSFFLILAWILLVIIEVESSMTRNEQIDDLGLFHLLGR